MILTEAKKEKYTKLKARSATLNDIKTKSKTKMGGETKDPLDLATWKSQQQL